MPAVPRQLRRVHQLVGQAAVDGDVLAERHARNAVAGQKSAVQHHSWGERGNLRGVPLAALDFTISDADDSGPTGESQRRQTQRCQQVQSGPPQPTRRAGDKDPVVAECPATNARALVLTRPVMWRV